MMLNTMVRSVERSGSNVNFFNMVGPFQGNEYNYSFPTEKLAIEFEKFAKQYDEKNTPIAISEEWRQYRVQ